jgi:hypothetical protein
MLKEKNIMIAMGIYEKIKKSPSFYMKLVLLYPSIYLLPFLKLILLSINYYEVPIDAKNLSEA